MKMMKKALNNNKVRDTLAALGGIAVISTIMTVLGCILYNVTNV